MDGRFAGCEDVMHAYVCTHARGHVPRACMDWNVDLCGIQFAFAIAAYSPPRKRQQKVTLRPAPFPEEVYSHLTLTLLSGVSLLAL